VTNWDDELLYTAGEAAKYLGVSRQRIYELAEAERMGKRIVGGWIFRQSELDAYKAERESKIEAVIPSPVVAV
jgi:excisionase family DNA binding protein